ncbi:Tegument antigen [Clonorchis sinensis]|uniref:Tegument antigen n=2 Tax=Clonorchis sinensis TaxID=79923 RepID=A0A8T1MJ17_CLOSI|nr:Tegument antigen [Clonorchis sinensis]GAA34310.1 tegument antigen [Clonorchis sinensis]
MTQQTAQSNVVEELMKCFMVLDVNNDGFVSRQELTDFCQKQNLSTADIDQFLQRFDTDADGKISFEEYARGLGLTIHEVQQEKKEIDLQKSREASGEKLKFDDVEILSTSMTWSKQEAIINKFKELVGGGEPNEEAMNNVVEQLQQFLNEEYGRLWQCIMLTGSYWMKFSHEPFMSLQFRYSGKLVVCVWRTNRA